MKYFLPLKEATEVKLVELRKFFIFQFCQWIELSYEWECRIFLSGPCKLSEGILKIHRRTVQLLMMTVAYFSTFFFFLWTDTIVGYSQQVDVGWGDGVGYREKGMQRRIRNKKRFRQRELKNLPGQVLNLPFKRAAAFCRLTIKLYRTYTIHSYKHRGEKGRGEIGEMYLPSWLARTTQLGS